MARCCGTCEFFTRALEEAGIYEEIAGFAQLSAIVLAVRKGEPNVQQSTHEEMSETIRRLEEKIEHMSKLATPAEHVLEHNKTLQARLTASEAKQKWTTARPTVAGWYWWRKLPDHKEEIVRLFLRNGFLCVDWGTKDADYLSPWAKDVDGEFQGPLTPGE